MQFSYASSPMDRYYAGNRQKDVKPTANIEEPILPFQEIGQSVTEGRQFGTFLDSAKAAIRTGTGRIELQPTIGGEGAEPGGVESYGREAREALREMAKVNQVQFTSVHTPPQIGNMSGFNPQQGGFSDEFRDKEMDEVKSAIKFAAEATQGGAVVIHTGEFQRPMFDAPWNMVGKWKDSFRQYPEEAERAVKPLVDIRTGHAIQEVRMNQLVPRPVWNRYESDNDEWKKHNGKSYTDEKGQIVRPGDYIDYEGRLVDRDGRMPKYDKEKNTFIIHQEKWENLVKEAEEINMIRAKKANVSYEEFIKSSREDVLTPEEAFLYATTETQEAIAKGWAGNYAQRVDHTFKNLEKLKKAREFYAKLESNIPEEEKWKLKKQVGNEFAGLVPPDTKMPVEILDEQIKESRRDIESVREMVTGQLEHAEQQKIMRENVTSASKYGIKQTMKSYAEAGIEAMRQSHRATPYPKSDIFLAPENIFPEMGYGSHPEELIQLVKDSRKEMVKALTEPYTIDSTGKKRSNPDYSGMSRSEAEKEAKAHIKATLDTQHLGMWFNNFEPLPGETREERKTRFDKWYIDEVEKMAKEDVIGNIHLVDCIGGSHQHLPAGQGDLPLKQAIKLLRSNGYKGPINSEAYGEERFGQGRILLETWREFGSNIYNLGSYGMPGMPGPSWGNVRNSYFGRSYPPYFIFGAYSPSNDWTLWSQVPME